jgi:hypothetical protein
MADQAADLASIDRLLRRYADIACRQSWAEFGEIVLPDATVSFCFGADGSSNLVVTGPDGLAKLGRDAVQAFTFYLYVPLNHVAELRNETSASGRVYVLESAIDRDDHWIDVYGRYDDDYLRTGGSWKIAGRRYRELARRRR